MYICLIFTIIVPEIFLARILLNNLNFKRFRGSRHTDERTFIFGEHPTFYQIDNYNYTAEELRLMDEMMAVWANFAKTG